MNIVNLKTVMLSNLFLLLWIMHSGLSQGECFTNERHYPDIGTEVYGFEYGHILQAVVFPKSGFRVYYVDLGIFPSTYTITLSHSPIWTSMQHVG